MRKQIFTVSLVMLFAQAYAQNSFRETILGQNGLSKHFTTLETNRQIAFSPSGARKIFGLDASSDLVLMKKEADNLGFVHYRYSQTYNGIPVENSMYIVHTKDGRLTGMSGLIVVDFDRQMSTRSFSSLAPKQAVDIAVKYVGAKKYAWQDEGMERSLKSQTGDNRASYSPAATLVWYNDGEEISPRDLRLAYKVDVYAREPLSRACYFVDAQTGKILGTKDELYFSDATGTANTAYSGTQTIHSDLNAGSYRLRDLTKGSGVITRHGESGQRGNDYSSASANWNLAGTNQSAMDAHFGVSQTYAFYLANFSRNSYNGSGGALYSYVNDPTYTDNAFWDGSTMNFCKRSTGDPGGVTGIDVTGHELTHGVTQATSNLTYSREPGAMNESMSDIMGKSVQFWSKPSDINWLLSNDMNWIIRDMSNPNAQGQPDTYKGTNWQTTSGDNYGVHKNSGVGNYMFYLLVVGGSGMNDIGNSFTVQGIGLAKADQIIYRTNTTYLGTMSQYANWRDACILAATDLYGANSNEVKQVMNAWYAVGIGDAAGSAYCSSNGASTANEWIQKVIFGTIRNNSGNNGGYADFSGLSTSITAGNSYLIQMQPGFTGAPAMEYWTVYIDFNHDGSFAGETVFKIKGKKTTAKKGNILIPLSIANGPTLMRIQMHNGSYITDPCATFNNGEVEDYTVNVSGGSGFQADNGFATNSVGEAKTSVFVTPNPVFGSSATIQYSLVQAGKVILKVFDSYGRSVQNVDFGNKDAGSYTYILKRTGIMSHGTYFIVVEQNNRQVGRSKFIMLK